MNDDRNRRSPARDALTELEQCVIGVVWRDGPMTAYEIASLFAASLSPYWSGSAGAIYPVVKRLAGRGLLSGTEKAWNRSKRTLLTVTRKGRSALRAWLRPPLAVEVGAPSFDSVRTRMFFVEALPPAGRLAFVQDAMRVSRAQLVLTRRRLAEQEAAGEDSEALGSLGVIYELEARLRWLGAVRDKVRAKERR